MLVAFNVPLTIIKTIGYSTARAEKKQRRLERALFPVFLASFTHAVHPIGMNQLACKEVLINKTVNEGAR